MEAATRGALEAGKKVGGIRIEREAGQVVKLVQGQHYLPTGTAAFCKVRRFPARVHPSRRPRGRGGRVAAPGRGLTSA